MVEKFTPEINKVYFINQYTLIQVIAGSGGIQVDFKNYFDWQDKAIYLEKGQYIKFLSDNFEVRKIEFPNETVFHNKDVRVLFKHLISLGYINFNDCEDCKKYLTNTVFSNKISEIIDVSSKQWYWQNPFQANKDEYQIIFDIKDVVDEQYQNTLTSQELTALITNNDYNAQALVKDKVGITVKALFNQKKLIESKKKVAFTDQSIQEIAFDLGYKDPAYFNRVFKDSVGQSPLQFRKEFDFSGRDIFSQNIIELLKKYHTQERSLEFYADKMNLSVKTLSKKVKDKMQTSLGLLIRYELINTSKSMLLEGTGIHEVAFRLGFEEPNHFSSFFKHYTGESPSDFKNKKYNL
ncbi:AraC family transcriptional regulator [Fulvivirgaceae bacterium BMA10]|uniref:AraC family transcriptional regulator n=1 Tax=Splendidivirga corallicola TaxID=3051826 RepID=A0ABT8KJ52_9BACT|nr:AraC family transcriptional regulator [Fulvivirgaceae bacterium BMA10]